MSKVSHRGSAQARWGIQKVNSPSKELSEVAADLAHAAAAKGAVLC